MAKNRSVLGIYPDRTTVSEAISALHKTGYRPADIAVLSPENPGSKDFAHEKSTKAPEGAAVGAAGGAVIFAGLGWLAAIRVIALPTLDQLSDVKPLMSSGAATHRHRAAAHE